MNDDLAVATSNGSIEMFEAALEEAGDVVERHLFRKVFLTILVLVAAAAVVNLVLKKAGSRKGTAEEPATPEAAPEPAPADTADESESDE